MDYVEKKENAVAVALCFFFLSSFFFEQTADGPNPTDRQRPDKNVT